MESGKTKVVCLSVKHCENEICKSIGLFIQHE